MFESNGADATEGRRVKSLVCKKLGDPRHVLELRHEKPLPCPPQCVRIKVIAASMNFADALQIEGTYQEKKIPPFVPGNEVSGIIVETGMDVRGHLRVGDSVCAITNGGAFSEEAIAPALGTVKVPKSSDVEASAGLPVAFGTAYMGLKQRADLKEGKSVLILGAAGGVGMAAVQIAKLLGATVIAAARGAAKMTALKEVGADVCLDISRVHTSKEFIDMVKKVAPGGVDVVFDPVGGNFGMDAVRTVSWGGHIIVVGFASGKMTSYPGNIVLVKNITLHGLYWGAHMSRKPEIFRESLEAVADMFARGDVVVRVSHRYSLENAQEAFAVLKNRNVMGKLLFCPGTRSML